MRLTRIPSGMLRVWRVSGQELLAINIQEQGICDVIGLKTLLRSLHGFPLCLQQLLHSGESLEDPTGLDASLDIQTLCRTLMYICCFWSCWDFPFIVDPKKQLNPAVPVDLDSSHGNTQRFKARGPNRATFMLCTWCTLFRQNSNERILEASDR